MIYLTGKSLVQQNVILARSRRVHLGGLLPRNLHQRSPALHFLKSRGGKSVGTAKFKGPVVAVIQRWQYYTSDHINGFTDAKIIQDKLHLQHNTLKPHWPWGY